MLSKEDNRRLAQLERQLQRDDPEFCARMGGGNFSVSATGRPPLPLLIVAAVLAVLSLLLVLAGWWIAGSLAAAWSVVTAIAAALRWRRHRAR